MKCLNKMLFAVLLMMAGQAWGDRAPVDLMWSRKADAKDFAVARPYFGIIDSNLIVVGGTSFDRLSVDGGTKSFRQEGFIYDLEKDAWSMGGHLPKGMGEGMSAVTSRGLFCVGGEGSRDVFFVNVTEEGTLAYDFLEEGFPGAKQSISMAGCTVWGDVVYVAGGKIDGMESAQCWSYDVKATKWSRLPDLPGGARVQPVMAAQNGDQKLPVVVCYGGASIAEDKRSQARFDGYGLVRGVWHKLKDAPVGTIGAGFIPVGDQHILLIGGYRAQVWDHANRMDQATFADFMRGDIDSFRWNRGIYAYHTVTGEWCEYSELPEDISPRCGAAVAIYEHRISDLRREPRVVMFGGEDRPGRRVNDLHVVRFERNWKFSWVSWIVIVVYFLLMGLMALFFILREKTADTYFRGGQSIPWVVVGMSIFATMLSSITFISIPTMTFISDWRYFPMVLCILALAPIAIHFYLPFFCRLKITSAYEYLEHRFNLGLRLFGAMVFNVFMICRVAVVTLLPAIALNAVTGIDVQFCILLCGVATILYCMVGGVDAVIWSDFVQGIILVLGALVVLVTLLMETHGGFTGFLELAGDAGKLRVLDFRWLFKEPTFWVVMVMGMISNLSSYTSDQCVVQRYITTTNERAAARSIWFNGWMSIGASVVFYMIGSALYTHYKSHPGLMDITMAKSDSVFPLFMAMELNPIVAGLIIAAIFAATISTLSTNLNSAATSITCDFVLRFNPSMNDRAQVNSGRICVLIVGVLGVVAALMLATMPSRSLFDVFNQFIGTLTAGLSALFFMGVFMPRVGGWAAWVGLIMNYIVCVSLNFLPVEIRPHSFLFGGVGLAVCLVVAYGMSFVFKNNKSTQGLTFSSKPKRLDE